MVPGPLSPQGPGSTTPRRGTPGPSQPGLDHDLPFPVLDLGKVGLLGHDLPGTYVLCYPGPGSKALREGGAKQSSRSQNPAVFMSRE